METTTKFVEIHSMINPRNGEVTLFIANEAWGPVVTGKNLAEAKKKMKEAFGLAMIANSFLHPASASLAAATATKDEWNKLENTLQSSF